MNSWRRSSVMWPVAVRVAIAVRHSSSVSRTSVANACRWRTSACMTSRRRASGDESKLASTAAVMSAGVVGWAAMSGALMTPILAHRARPDGGAVRLPRPPHRRAATAAWSSPPALNAPRGQRVAGRERARRSRPSHTRLSRARRASARRQQHLARGLAGGEVLLRLARLVERVARADPDVEAAVGNPAEHLARAVEQLVSGRDVVREARAGQEQRAAGVQPLRVDRRGGGAPPPPEGPAPPPAPPRP